ncbi:UNVERIFIED_CONTAM: hypothetical protein K2H54_007565 [Gekko kuhli]
MLGDVQLGDDWDDPRGQAPPPPDRSEETDPVLEEELVPKSEDCPIPRTTEQDASHFDAVGTLQNCRVLMQKSMKYSQNILQATIGRNYE